MLFIRNGALQAGIQNGRYQLGRQRIEQIGKKNMESTNLTFRFGKTIENPSAADIEDAISELVNEGLLEVSSESLAEHPNAWLQYGQEVGDDWAVYTLDVYRTRTVRFTHFADQDDDDPIFEYSVSEASKEELVALMALLSAGKTDDVKRRLYPSV